MVSSCESGRGRGRGQCNRCDLREPDCPQQDKEPHEEAKPEEHLLVNPGADKSQDMCQWRRLHADLKRHAQAFDNRPEVPAELPQEKRKQATLESDPKEQPCGIVRPVRPPPPCPGEQDEQDDERRGHDMPGAKHIESPAHPGIGAVP